MSGKIAEVRRIKLGSQGLEVSAQGLGCMGMSAFYGPPKPEPDMIALIRHAVISGITFLDTSDIYGPFTNESLVGKALTEGWRQKVELATKFGIRSIDHGPIEVRGDPAYVREACEGSLQRLGVDCIDLYYQHRIDSRIPIEVTMRELKKLVEEGKIKYIGLSEASASTIRRAHAVHPVTAIQLEWSLWTRDSEKVIIPTCRELGIGIVAYSPLGRGFLCYGPKMVETLVEQDYRKNFPRFQAGNLEQNASIFERVKEMASRKGCTPSQLALAWVHHQGNDVCPIPGTTKIENLNQNIGALSIKLTPEEMAELESYVSEDDVKGDRNIAGVPSWTDSETPPLSSWKGRSRGTEAVPRKKGREERSSDQQISQEVRWRRMLLERRKHNPDFYKKSFLNPLHTSEHTERLFSYFIFPPSLGARSRDRSQVLELAKGRRKVSSTMSDRIDCR